MLSEIPSIARRQRRIPLKRDNNSLTNLRDCLVYVKMGQGTRSRAAGSSPQRKDNCVVDNETSVEAHNSPGRQLTAEELRVFDVGTPQGRGRPLPPATGYGALAKKLPAAIMPAAKSSKIETPTNYDQVVAARARNVYDEAPDYPKSPQVTSDEPLIPGARGQVPYNVIHKSQGKKYYTPPDGPPVTSVQCRTVRVKPPSQPLVELFSGPTAEPPLPQPGRSAAHTPGQTPMRLMLPTSAQALQTPQRSQSGDKSRSQTGERGTCPGLARRQPLQAIGAPQGKSGTSARPSPCPIPLGTPQSRPQEDRGRQPAIEFSSDKPREQSSGRAPNENYGGYIVRRSPSPPRSAPAYPQKQLQIYEGAGDKSRSQSALRALEMVLAEPSRSIGDFVTEKSRGASPQIEAGRSEANPAAASAINQAGSSKASSPANKASPDNDPSRSESPTGDNTGWIVADQLIGQDAPECEEMIEQRIADLRNLPLLEDDPVYHLGRTLNTDEHIILDEILEDEIREIPGYQMSPGQTARKERRTEDKSTSAQAENVCAPCPSSRPTEQELDKPNIFKSIAKKIGITMEILSKLVHGRQPPAIEGPRAESSSQAKPEDSGPNIRNLYTEEEPDDDVELPESYKACANAKKCGRIKFDKLNHCDDVAVNTATRQMQIKELVMDNYCPGAIQEAIDGKEDFNAVAFELARVPCTIDEKACTNAPAEEPLSIIEAFVMRIDIEREGMKKGLKKDASEEEIKSSLRKYFETEHNPTDLNKSINSLLMAEALTDVAIAKASKTVTFEADVQKWASSIPDNPNIKLVSYTATTNPVILEESPEQPASASKTPDPS
uniref:Uncharacterized protein n=1 Tax=Glossina morsitans morsitans TaxID=37546 RepID=A0A1B0GAX1_GLOMM